MKKKFYVFIITMLFSTMALTATLTAQVIRYVKAGGNGTGASWANASGDLQAIINASGANDQVWVAKGVYKPTTTTDRTLFFAMKEGVKIYGSFAGTEATLAQRTRSVMAANPTILSGDLNGDDVITGTGSTLSFTNTAENSYHVIKNNGNLTAAAVLDGFTVTGGNENENAGAGGGISLSNSSPTITNCIFSGNQAALGGGMCNNNNSSPNLSNVIFSRNICITAGGGLGNFNASSPNLSNVIFSGNSSGTYGGGMYSGESSTTNVINTIFSGNNCELSGGGLNFTSATNIQNSIFWGNTKNGTAVNNIGNNLDPTAVANVSFSDIQGGYAGTGNINKDPLFVNAANPAGADGVFGNADDGLIPTACSPVLNAGINTGVASTDIVGNPRIFNTTVDMGAYELQSDPPTRLYVKATATGTNSGLSWANAFTDLQAALNYSCKTNLTEIWVAKGTYQPTAGSDRTISFVMLPNVKIYGGFAGTETALSQRTIPVIAANPAILSGDLNGNDIITGSGSILSITNNAENSYHVITNGTINLTAEAVLDGFTITGGNANGNGLYSIGGGISLSGSSPTITNCSFFGNRASVYGGGMFCNQSSPTLKNVAFSRNSSSNRGGGIYNSESALSLVNVIVSGNNSGNSGGGMFNEPGSSTSAPSIINTTFYGNNAGSGGGGLDFTLAPTIQNSIFWANTISGTAASNLTNTFGSTPANVSFSDIQGGYAGTGNINQDPLFVNAANPAGADGVFGTADDGLIPTACSPVLNVGINTGVASTDIIGNPRIFNTTADMGAYELQTASLSSPTRLYVKAGATGANSGLSWANAFADLQAALNYSCKTNLTEIWVAKGTYQPTAGSDRTISFVLLPNVKIYGGFAGTETALSQRTRPVIVANPTILSGDLNDNDIITGTGSTLSIANNAENSYQVIGNINSLTAAAVLDGFTITGGNANGAGVLARGGGMYLGNSSPTIANCNFSGNKAGSGGGIYDDQSSPTLNNVSFSRNIATNRGGGVSNLNGSSPGFINVIFSGNNATTAGGGMYSDGLSTPSLINTIFSGNNAATGGGGLDFSTAATIQNSIFWGNTAGGTTASNITNTFSSTLATVSYSDIQGGYAGTSNINQDPLFVNADNPAGADGVFGTADDGLVPAICSPILNAGTNAGVAATDIIGNPRIFNTTADMGAYELQTAAIPSPTRLYVNAGATGANSGLSWADAFTDLQAALNYSCKTNLADIWVAKGTYKPGNDRLISFVMLPDVKMYGGFAGTETTLSQRTVSVIAANPTILSGDLNGDDVITGFGSTLSINSNAENSAHVITDGFVNLTAAAVLDGFTITGGNASNNPFEFGGGIMLISSSPTISNCIFSGNRAANLGGGMYNSRSSLILNNVTFSRNVASGGGGMYNSESATSLINVIFSGNNAVYGGGMYSATGATTSTPSLINTTFSGNNAVAGSGGLVFNLAPTIQNSIFWGNTVGGAVAGSISNYSDGNSLANISYSDIQGGYAGTGNINVDPQFADAANGDTRLQASSCVINTGSNAAAAGISTDFAGNPRIYNNGTVDMGAYEYQGTKQAFVPPVATTNNALNFDGTNDYVSISTTNFSTCTSTAPALTSALTIEYWFKGSNIQSAVRFQDANGYILAGWNGNTTDPYYHILSNDAALAGVKVGAAATDGNWHHIAVTWQQGAANGFKSYLDGVLVEQRNAANTQLPSISGLYLGSYPGTSEFMNGSLDEVRVWSIARSQADINAGMCGGVTTPQTGLLMYYKFDHGTANGSNAGKNMLLNSANPNQYNGTLQNFALTGTSSNWVTTKTLPAAPTSGGNQVQCAQSPIQTLTATATVTSGSIVWYDAASAGNVVASPALNTAGTVTYYAQASDGVCSSLTRTAVTLTINTAQSAPVSGGNQVACAQSPIQTLTATATGGTIVWYDAANGGNIVANPTLSAVGTVTYYAQSSNSACNSLTRTAVTLTINPAPAAPVSGGDQTQSAQSPIQTLTATATGGTITWYDAASAGNVIANPTLNSVGTITYYAQSSNGVCSSVTRTAVKLTITPAVVYIITASAGANGSISPTGSVGVASGTNKTFTITPNAGYAVQAVSVDNVSQGAIASYTFNNVTAGHSITASFVSTTPTTSSNAGSNLTITLPTSSVVLDGSASTGNIVEYYWYQAPQQSPVQVLIANSFASVTTASGFTTPGTYVFGLQVKDNTGALYYSYKKVTVLPASANPVPACVTNTSPANASVLTTQTTATLTWPASATATSYDVYLQAGTGTPTTLVANTAALTYSANGLAANTTYSWYIAPANASGPATTCGGTNKTIFTTAAASGNQTTTSNAGINVTIVLPTSSVTLDGTASTGNIVQYYWYQTQGPVQAVIGNNFASVTTAGGLTIAGTYVFGLQVKDNNGVLAYSGKTVVVSPAGAGAAPACVTNTSPANASVLTTQTTATLTWPAAATATSYDVYLQAGTGIPATLVANTAALNYSASGLTANTTYSWYIAPRNASGPATACGTTNKTTFATAAATTGNQAPVSNAGSNVTITLPTNAVTLDGSASYDPDGSITQYYWFQAQGLVQSAIGNNFIPVTTASFTTAGTYVFGLQVKDNNGALSYSYKTVVVKAAGTREMDPVTITTPSLKANEGSSLPSVTAVISPNPVITGSQAKLQINSSKAGTVMVNIVSGNGAIIGTKKVYLVAGTNTTTVNTAGLAQGFHIISISGAAKPLNLKLVIQ